MSSGCFLGGCRGGCLPGASTMRFGVLLLTLCFWVGLTDMHFPQELHAADGVHNLEIGHVSFAEFGFQTRGFNGGIPGPTFRMNPGETLEVNFTNNLDPANNHNCNNLGDEHYCETATSNMHTHGLHVSPKGMEDGLMYYADDVFADVLPGESVPFKFPIPDYHMPGTHWYHPHHHHATALQAGGGAAGALIVNDPPGYLPDVYAEMKEKVIFFSAHNLQTLQEMAVESDSTLLENAIDTATQADLPTNVFLANGELGPTHTIESHSWCRFRMIYAAVEQSLNLRLLPSTGGASCSMQLMAKDGVYLPTMPREIETIHLFPGARADVAISCVCEEYPCSALLASDANAPGGLPPPPPPRRLQRPPRPPGGKPPPGMGGGGPPPDLPAAEGVSVNITYFLITEKVGGTRTTLPPVSVERPCYAVDLRSLGRNEVESGRIALNGRGRRVEFNGQGQRMTFDAVQAIGSKLNWPALAQVEVGKVYEFTVEGNGAHPLHIHVNPYQIVELPNNNAPLGNGYFQVGDWHDTLLLPGLGGGDSMKVRMQMDRFTGKMVIHCHILAHEDEGMMAFINIAGNEGTVWAGAEQIDGSCARGAFSATTPSTGLTTAGTITTSSDDVSGACRVQALSSTTAAALLAVLLASSALGI